MSVQQRGGGGGEEYALSHVEHEAEGNLWATNKQCTHLKEKESFISMWQLQVEKEHQLLDFTML